MQNSFVEEKRESSSAKSWRRATRAYSTVFTASGVPYGYRVQAIHGFVEELVVNDDPEYQWIDKIRSQRASNEARQILFSKLSGTSTRYVHACACSG